MSRPVDITEIAQKKASRTISRGPVTVTFGREVKKVTTPPEGESKTEVLGWDIYPRHFAHGDDESTIGVVIDFKDRMGGSHTATVSSANSMDRNSRRKEAKRLAGLGANLVPDRGDEAIKWLVHWGQQGKDVQVVRATGKAGWSENGLVVGPHNFGSDVEVGGDVAQIKISSRGTHDGWMCAMQEHIRTPVQLLASGAGFGSTLLGGLNRNAATSFHPFIMHIAGPSSSGKSNTARAAASIFDTPDATSRFLTWNFTTNAIEHNLARLSGTLVVLDEIKESSPLTAARVIHLLADGRGKERSRRDGTGTLATNTWETIAISTGENSSREHTGAYHQGGHAVRCIDLMIDHGEACVDAQHAAELERAIERNHGTAWRPWAEYLTGLSPEEWGAIRDRIDDLVEHHRHLASDAEMGRVLKQVVFLAVALEQAITAEVCPPLSVHWHVGADRKEATTSALIHWTMERIDRGRGGATSPNARAYLRLCELYESEPVRFPRAGVYGQSHEVLGVTPQESDMPRNLPPGTDSPFVYTSENILKSSEVLRDAGASPRSFVDWMVDHRLASRADSPFFVGNHQRRWIEMVIDDAAIRGVSKRTASVRASVRGGS